MEQINSDTKWMSLKYNPKGCLRSSRELTSSFSRLFSHLLSASVCLLPHRHTHILFYTPTRAQSLHKRHANTLRPDF